MGGAFLTSFFAFIAGVFTLLWLPLLLWRLLGNRRRRVAQPACAQCLYPTETVTTGTCHECGADLVREGVITPSMRVRQGGGVLLAAASWSVLVVLGSLTLASWASFAIPVPTRLMVNVQGVPNSGAFRDFDVRGSGEIREGLFSGFGPVESGEFTLVIHGNDGVSHQRTFTREKGEASFRLDDGRMTDDYTFTGLTTADVVRELLVAAGAPANDVSTDQEAQEIAGILTAGVPWWVMGSGGAFHSVSNGSMTRVMDENLYMISKIAPFVIMLVGASSWLAGTVLLFGQHARRDARKRARRTESAEPALAPSSVAR